MSLSGSLSDNRQSLVEANKIIKDLESEANELAESIGLDKDVILAAACGQNSSEMTSVNYRTTLERWHCPPPRKMARSPLKSSRCYFDHALRQDNVLV